MKTQIKLPSWMQKNFFIALIFFLLIIGGIYFFYFKNSTNPVNASRFLKKYYTVEQYIEPPESLDDIDALQKMYLAYMTPNEIDRFIKNRFVLDPSLIAEEKQCTLLVKDVKLYYLKEDSSKDYSAYKYVVTIEVCYKNKPKTSIVAKGLLRMDSPSRDALITYFSPDKNLFDAFY